MDTPEFTAPGFTAPRYTATGFTEAELCVPELGAPEFTDEIPADCACAGCADAAARIRDLGAGRCGTALHGVRLAVVATVGAVALTGAGAGTARAEPAPAHAGWDGSRYWFKNAAGEWRWTSRHSTYVQRTSGAGTTGSTSGSGGQLTAAGGGRTGEPVFRGRQGWDPQDRVYWYKYRGHWYWTSHKAKYEQRTGTSGNTSKPTGPTSPTPPSSRGWTVPVSSYVFTGYYGQPGSWSRGYHTGQDFAVPTGTTVRSVGPGRVVTAGYGRSYGYEVVIRHPDGRYTQYAHLSRIDVSPGQSVSAGQRIARSGATGRVTGAHLHFEVRTTPYFGSDINPLAYLRGHGVRV
ncbi:M23 family metallopeptidase [Streptomyces sp. NBC_00094]|uniref:M23 family metallopeptidase n=1 Tax=Streptomyces sp. NBC_00094 TaxID=2903620 RepID=UPI002B1E3216|nr:M23 family metallopeptidase [Streptomyces sp. NBC_00094]